MKFERFEELEESIAEYAKQQQRHFFSYKSCHYDKLLDGSKIPSRGYFYCSEGKEACQVRISFTSFVSNEKKDRKAGGRIYVIKNNYIMKHSHDISTPVTYEGKVVIKYERELTEQEYKFFMDFGAHVPADKLRRILRPVFPNREYTSDLIQRVVKKAKVAHFGNQSGTKDLIRPKY